MGHTALVERPDGHELRRSEPSHDGPAAQFRKKEPCPPALLQVQDSPQHLLEEEGGEPGRCWVRLPLNAPDGSDKEQSARELARADGRGSGCVTRHGAHQQLLKRATAATEESLQPGMTSTLAGEEKPFGCCTRESCATASSPDAETDLRAKRVGNLEELIQRLHSSVEKGFHEQATQLDVLLAGLGDVRAGCSLPPPKPVMGKPPAPRLSAPLVTSPLSAPPAVPHLNAAPLVTPPGAIKMCIPGQRASDSEEDRPAGKRNGRAIRVALRTAASQDSRVSAENSESPRGLRQPFGKIGAADRLRRFGSPWPIGRSGTSTGVSRHSTVVTKQLRAAMQRGNTMAHAASDAPMKLFQTLSGSGDGVNSPMGRCRGWLVSMVTTRAFDAFMGLLIVLNTVLIGYQADQRAQKPDKEEEPVVFIIDKCFTMIFLVEILVRMVAFGKHFIIGQEWRFNLFDLLIVSASIIEELIDFVDVIFLRIVRTLKLVRIFRVFRTVEFFRELRMMMLSIVSCMRSLFWLMFLLVTVIYMYAIGIIMCVYQDMEKHERTHALFGTLGQAMLTLFQSITGGIDWIEITDSLGLTDPLPAALFVSYIAFVLFAVMNIMTGFFVEQAMKAAEKDLENMINEEMHDRRRVIAHLKLFLQAADKENDGVITWEELNEQLKLPSVQAYFKTLKLETNDLRSFFELVSIGGKSAMSIDQLVTCCMRLKGPARSSDVLLLRHELEAHIHHVLRALESLASTSSLLSVEVHARASDQTAESLAPSEMSLS